MTVHFRSWNRSILSWYAFFDLNEGPVWLWTSTFVRTFTSRAVQFHLLYRPLSCRTLETKHDTEIEMKWKKMNCLFPSNSLINHVVESWMNEWSGNILKWFFTFSKNIFLEQESMKENSSKNIAIVRNPVTDRSELVRDLKYSLVLVWSEVSNFSWFWSVTYKPSFEPKNLL